MSIKLNKTHIILLSFHRDAPSMRQSSLHSRCSRQTHRIRRFLVSIKQLLCTASRDGLYCTSKYGSRALLSSVFVKPFSEKVQPGGRFEHDPAHGWRLSESLGCLTRFRVAYMQRSNMPHIPGTPPRTMQGVALKIKNIWAPPRKALCTNALHWDWMVLQNDILWFWWQSLCDSSCVCLCSSLCQRWPQKPPSPL